MGRRYPYTGGGGRDYNAIIFPEGRHITVKPATILGRRTRAPGEEGLFTAVKFESLQTLTRFFMQLMRE